MTKIEVTITAEVDDKFICDLFTTALEGGIGYWSGASHYEWGEGDDIDNFKAVIHELDPDDPETADAQGYGPPIVIDHALIVKGLAALAQWRPDRFQRAVIEEDYDAEDADIIVQLAIFGEVKYG